MILIKIWYKIYTNKLLAIIKIFKTWHYYLKSCKYKILIFINYNDLYYFIDIKNLNFK